jgi:hypothetical protein
LVYTTLLPGALRKIEPFNYHALGFTLSPTSNPESPQSKYLLSSLLQQRNWVVFTDHLNVSKSSAILMWCSTENTQTKRLLKSKKPYFDDT